MAQAPCDVCQEFPTAIMIHNVDTGDVNGFCAQCAPTTLVTMGAMMGAPLWELAKALQPDDRPGKRKPKAATPEPDPSTGDESDDDAAADGDARFPTPADLDDDATVGASS